jgi:hypothetical protein
MPRARVRIAVEEERAHPCGPGSVLQPWRCAGHRQFKYLHNVIESMLKLMNRG